MSYGNKYDLEKVLYFASQKSSAGFNVKPSEKENKTDLWGIVSKSVNARWLVQKKGTHDYQLTVSGYVRLLSEKAHYQDRVGNLTKLEAIKEDISKITQSFIDGVNPTALYSPKFIDDILKKQSLPQLLTRCLDGVAFSIEISPENEALSDALSAGALLRKNGDFYQITMKGVSQLGLMRVASAELNHRGGSVSDIKHDIGQAMERIDSYINQTRDTLKDKTPATCNMIDMLSEAANGSVSAIGVLLLDETRTPLEMATAAHLLSEKLINQVGEDDSGRYMEITPAGRMALLNMQLDTASTPEDKQFYRKQIYTEQKRQELPIHTSMVPDGVMDDLSLYRLFVTELARLHFTERQLSFINELAVDFAFSDQVQPGELVEQWRLSAQSVTHPEEIMRRRQEVLAHGVQWLRDIGFQDHNHENVVNAMELASVVKERTGWHLPYHEAESILSEAKRSMQATLCHVAQAPLIRSN